MKYLQSISPFQLISAFTQRAQQPPPKDQLEKTTLSESENTQMVCSYEEAEKFILQVRKAVAEQFDKQNAIRRKISIFEKIEVEPHYLEATSSKKIMEFQFQLGSHAFLERTEVLYQQISEINTAVREILKDKGEAVQQFFEELQGDCRRVNELIQKLRALRYAFTTLRQQKEFTIKRLMSKKLRIKEKLHLLKNVKAKNEAAFIQITNIDQAFVTQQARVKLYRKLTNLTELDRSKYVAIIRNKLIATCRNNKILIEEGIKAWASGKLNEKQIEKLAFMIYFLEKEDIYRDHQIKVDYSIVDKARLTEEIGKIFSWESFHYMRDAATRGRIHEFLHFLLKRIQ